MVGSFSLSIILFLAFSVTVDFMNHAIRPLKPWASALSIASPKHTLSIDSKLVNELERNPAVKRAYGRMMAFNVPVTLNGQAEKINLVSYEKHQTEWARNYVLTGSIDKLQHEAYTGLMVFDMQTTVSVGITITLRTGKQAAKVNHRRHPFGQFVCQRPWGGNLDLFGRHFPSVNRTNKLHGI